MDGLKRALEELGADVGLVAQPRDLVYFAGISTLAQLIVPLEGEPVLLAQIDAERARDESAIDDVRPSRGLKTVKQAIADLGPSAPVVAAPLDVLPYDYVERLLSTVDGSRVVDISPAVLDLRSVKSPPELAVLREAAGIAEAGVRHARRVLRPGLSEIELQLELEKVEQGMGGDGWMSHRAWNLNVGWGMLCSGAGTASVSGYWLTSSGFGSSAAQPYAAGRRTLRPGDLVILDRGVVLDGYHCDEARTLVVGEPSERQLHYWEALGHVMAAALEAVRPGAPVSGVYDSASGAAQEAGIGDVFMTRALHGFEYVGHGVGLEIDEPPLVAPGVARTLVPGMVLALEPKVIVPGWGGLTFEETVAVTGDGCEVLTRSPVAPLGVHGC